MSLASYRAALPRMAVFFSDTSHGGDVLSASRKRMAGFRVNVRGLHAGWGLDTCVRQRSSTLLASGHGCVDSAVRHCRPYCLIYSSQAGYMGSDIPIRVGLTGFEPATPCSQSTRATKLRHNPNIRQNVKTWLRAASLR